ncbi:MAG: hypothetical protein RLZZ623_2493 [Actinomycetota bacterium]|jgi:Flp pilus assembly protein TadG
MTRDPAPSDRGSLTIITMFLLIVALAGGGLIVDGGRALTARRHATNTAEAAARFAVSDQSLSGQSLTGQFDEVRAITIARSYAERSGIDTRDVTVAIRHGITGRAEVVVTITEHRPTVFLALGGRSTMTVRSVGAATFVYSV